jgi:glycosyltransferase involved in cell wall biosynthesis
MTKLVVMIPAYNEEKTIGKVIKEIPRKIKGFKVKVLVINDGSTDKTVKVSKKAGADKIVTNKMNLGLAKSFRKGLETALKMKADIIVNIDADGQYNAKEIPKLIRPIMEEKADMVLGWRDVVKLDHMPVRKKIGNRIATLVTGMITDIPVIDAQTGFRAFSRECAMKMNLKGHYTYVQETIFQAKYKDLKIEQVPVDFRRRDGDSRLISNIFRYATRAGGTIIRTYRDYEPFKVFLAVGGVIGLVGFGFGLRVLVHFLQTGLVTPYVPSAILASMLMMIGFQVVIFGLLAEMIKDNRETLDELLFRVKEGNYD